MLLPTNRSIIRGASPFWRGVLKLSQVFQEFTFSKVDDERSTSFWYDVWAIDTPLSKVLPDLQCFAINSLISTAGFFSQNDRQSNFNAPLNYVTTEGYLKLINYLSTMRLTEDENIRI